jgi:cytochrome c2
VVGRASGGAGGTAGGSGGQLLEGLVWTDGALMNYMKSPRVFAAQRIQMNFQGIVDFQTRVDILHYLHTLTDENPDLQKGPKAGGSRGV